jgi:hypothetical protein
MSVSPHDIVRLDGRGDMSAKSAVRIVMQEWSGEAARGAKITEQVGEKLAILHHAHHQAQWLRCRDPRSHAGVVGREGFRALAERRSGHRIAQAGAR